MIDMYLLHRRYTTRIR